VVRGNVGSEMTSVTIWDNSLKEFEGEILTNCNLYEKEKKVSIDHLLNRKGKKTNTIYHINVTTS